MTQKVFANAVGVSSMTVCRWEWGERTPRMEEIKRIASALHVTEDELLNGPREKKIEINLIFGEMPEKGEIDMSENGNNFDVFMGKNGTLGIRGGANFTSIDEIIKFGAEVVEQLKQGFEFQKQRGAIAATGD